MTTDYLDEQWLDRLLGEPAPIAEHNFSAQVMQTIQHGKRRRHLILGGGWLLAAITLLLLSEQFAADLWHWVKSLFATSMNTDAAITKIGQLNLDDIQQWLLQSHAAPLVLVAVLSIVCIMQWLLQNE